MELRVLRYFLAVAREGNITGAANFLHLTQPTLSRQIKDLEEELGCQLLMRKSHRVVLTPEGMRLRKRAEEIISMVDKTEAEFLARENAVSGDIYIGGGETQAIRQIAEIIRELHASGTTILLVEQNAQAALEVADRAYVLETGLITKTGTGAELLADESILIQPADISKYDYINLPSRDRWGVIMRKDSPMAAKESIRKEDLLDVPLICSRQVMTQRRMENEFADWFGDDFDRLHDDV